MADDDYDEELDEGADWQSEAGKWKELAAKHERAAAENAGAAERLAALEKAGKADDDRHAEELKAAKAEGDEAAKEAKADGDKTAAEWQSEAAKWKELAQKHEQLSKKNLAAAARLDKLEAEGKVTKEKATADKADLEAKATAATAKAIRLEVAQELGVPKDLIDLLKGTSKKEIEEAASELIAQLDRNKAPEPEPEPAKAEDEALAKERAELAEARKRADEAEAKALRLEIAAEKQLPSGLAELLTGTTREDLERQANALRKHLGPIEPERPTRGRMPTARLRPGALPEGADEPDADPSAIAEAIYRRQRGY